MQAGGGGWAVVTLVILMFVLALVVHLDRWCRLLCQMSPCCRLELQAGAACHGDMVAKGVLLFQGLGQ